MELFLSIEAQNCIENGLDKIFADINNQLVFVTDKKAGLAELNNYGTEFREIAIIPTCVNNDYWSALGWKERTQIWRKKKEADIRLRMDYERFIKESENNKRLMLVEIIIRSIKVVQEKSKDDFRGEDLIKDILSAVDITQEQLSTLAVLKE